MAQELSEYLAANPDCRAAEACAALGWFKPKLTKHPLWKAHINRQVGECIQSNPGATIRQVKARLGLSLDAIQRTKAWRERMAAPAVVERHDEG